MNSLPSSRFATSATLTLVTTLVILAVVGGCTSDDPNPVGADLHESAIDETLTPLTADVIVDFGVLDVIDTDVPLDETEVLYFGISDTEESSILTTYDFTVLDHPDSAYLLPYLTPENIRRAEIRLYMLEWYTPWRGGFAPGDSGYAEPDDKLWPGLYKNYDIHELIAPYDTLSYPGAEPAFQPWYVDSQEELESKDSPITIKCDPETVAGWLTARSEVSIIIRERPGSDPGLLGFASKEMVHGGSTLGQLNAGVTLGAAVRVLLDQTPEDWPADRQYAIFGPSADISTWHVVQPPYTDPDEGVMMRTHLRSYPMIRFNLDELPEHVRINRANLVVYNDTTRSEGHRTVITCSELPPAFAPPGQTTVELADIEPEVYFLAGTGSFVPEHKFDHEIKLNVTSSIQRYINDAYTGERGFLIAAGEYFFPGWNSNPDPDFWFTKWVFFGAQADSAQRPRLEISYTLLDELSGTEETP